MSSVSMSTEVVNKRFKKKLKSGIIYFGIGIVLIIIGIILWITAPWQGAIMGIKGIHEMVAIVLWFIAAIPFLNGVGLLVVSAVIKVRMENLKKRYKGVLITGCFFLGIGIVLILMGGAYTMTIWPFYFLMLSLAFFCVGGVLLFASSELKKRMNKIEKT